MLLLMYNTAVLTAGLQSCIID